MEKYTVTVEEVVRLYVTVEATSEADARKKAIVMVLKDSDNPAIYDTQVESRYIAGVIKS